MNLKMNILAFTSSDVIDILVSGVYVSLKMFQRDLILAPIAKFSDVKKVDLIVRFKGGGLESQANATRLGISRALLAKDEALRADLGQLGFLTRDSRKKERKKYGRKIST